MKKILILIIISFFTSSFECSSQPNKIITRLFLDLQSNMSKDILYDKYFYKEQKGEAGRSYKDISVYKDSLFKEIKDKVSNKYFTILSLKKIKIKYPKYNFYSNYYKEQENKIYVCVVGNKLVPSNIIYIYIEQNKIISLLPIKSIDNKIIQWF